MKIILNKSCEGCDETLTTNFHQNFSHFFNALDISKKHGAPTEYMAFQSNVKEGTIHRLIPRSDLEVVISDYAFYQNYQMQMSTKQPMVELSFCMQGVRGIQISGLNVWHNGFWLFARKTLGKGVFIITGREDECE
ncbi:hypothetical protein [Lysinibacillus parviboronicapiens]|uniref:hypothetical protein n=1 Tax=Lysinibacillus parviboronicapiens TaxID=436516 RepID=UPI00308329DD